MSPACANATQGLRRPSKIHAGSSPGRTPAIVSHPQHLQTPVNPCFVSPRSPAHTSELTALQSNNQEQQRSLKSRIRTQRATVPCDMHIKVRANQLKATPE
uniref:Uncharacterized protein n=1 Tax=Physcomitrium patens TaxID=3218 RepID=A0A2K1J049_PHYPA|nr:hypothetical protein PHYPA_022796 [Physcomitrium patens]